MPETVKRSAPGASESERRPLRERVTDKVKAGAKELSARAQTAKEIIGLACIPLAGAAAIHTARWQRQNPESSANFISPFTLDVQTVQMHGDALATAVAELSDSYPALGQMLDRIGMISPAAGIVGVGVMIAMQIAENHNKLSPAAREFSPVPIVPRDEMGAILMANAAAGAPDAPSTNGA